MSLLKCNGFLNNYGLLRSGLLFLFLLFTTLIFSPLQALAYTSQTDISSVSTMTPNYPYIPYTSAWIGLGDSDGTSISSVGFALDTNVTSWSHDFDTSAHYSILEYSSYASFAANPGGNSLNSYSCYSVDPGVGNSYINSGPRVVTCGSPVTTVSGHYYALYFFMWQYPSNAVISVLGSNSGTQTLFFDSIHQTVSPSDVVDAAHQVNGPLPPDDTRTRIDTVTPPNDSPPWSQARATSTTFAFGATGYASSTDWVDGMNVHISYRNNASASNQLVGPSFSWVSQFLPGGGNQGLQAIQTPVVQGSFDLPITAPGAFTVSTSTNIQQIGVYTLTTSITVPSFNFFGVSFGSNSIVSTTTQFEVATSTRFDLASQQIQEQWNEIASGGSYNCNIDFSTAFDTVAWTQCFLYFFVPSDQSLAITANLAANSFLKAQPWGYLTLAIQDFTATSTQGTSTLPALAITFPSSQGLPSAVAGHSFTLTPWNEIAGPGSFLANATVPESGNHILDEFLNYWNLLWVLMFALWVVNEFYGAWKAGDFTFISGMSNGSLNKGISAYRGLVANQRSRDYRNLVRVQNSINRYRR